MHEVNKCRRFLLNIPILRIWLPMLAGYLLPFQFTFSIVLSAVLLLFLLSIFLRNQIRIITLLCALFLVGNGFQAYESLKKNKVFSVSYPKQYYYFEVEDYPIEKTNSDQMLCTVRSTSNPATKHNILVYLPKLSADSFQPGDCFVSECKPKAFAPPSLPFGFNYQRYMERKGICLQAYCKQLNKVQKKQNRLSLVQRSRIVRRYLRDCLIRSGVAEDDLGLIMAVSLGEKTNLSDEVKATFRKSGTMHILCVSGLHVGIVAFLLYWLFSPILWLKGCANVVHKALIVLGLVLFAFLSGLTPSVLRAVAMCAVYFYYQSVSRQGNHYQTLLMVAYVLFLWHPAVIFDLGYLLSFSAVAGILYFYPKLNRLWFPRNTIVKYFYQIVCVSIAAQLAVMPLAVYYFHQFPIYGVFANLIGIPLIFVDVVLCWILILFSVIGIPTAYVMKVLSICLYLLKEGLHGISMLPFATLNIQSPNYIVLFLLLFLLYYGFSAFTIKKRRIFYRIPQISLLLFIVLLIGSIGKNDIVFSKGRHANLMFIPQNDTVFVIYAGKSIKQKNLDYLLPTLYSQFHCSNVKVYQWSNFFAIQGDWRKYQNYLIGEKEGIIVTYRSYSKNNQMGWYYARLPRMQNGNTIFNSDSLKWKYMSSQPSIQLKSSRFFR